MNICAMFKIKKSNADLLRTKIIMDIVSKIILALLLSLSSHSATLHFMLAVRGTEFGTRLFPLPAVGTDPALPKLPPVCWQCFSRTLASWRLCLCTAYPNTTEFGGFGRSEHDLLAWISRNNLTVQLTMRQGTCPSSHAF